MSRTCHFADCLNSWDDTIYLTVDALETRWFCRHHWRFICYFFNSIISNCIKEDLGCERNHKVELDISEVNLAIVKFNNKYYDLCDNHMNTYEELVGWNSMFGI
jgi:hypothetical protein